MNYEELKKANETIRTIVIHDKQYAEVSQRIKAFRMCYPEGLIHTEMISNENGVCIFEARVYTAERSLLAVGHAYEKEGSSLINRTSYLENAETSAIGRALGIAGFGIDFEIASAEEVQNAVANQDEEKAEEIKKKASPNQIKIISKLYETRLEEMLAHYGLEKIEDMPMELASKIIDAKRKEEAK